jgi:hypothetical protein
LGLLLLILLILASLTIAIRLPKVQTYAVHKAATWISETIGHKVTIESVDIKLFSRVVLDKVKVLDIRNQEMFYIGQTEADISLFSVFHPDKLHISTLKLTEPHCSLIEYKGTDSLNLSTFIHALGKLIKKDPNAPKSTFEFKINRIVLEKGYFSFDNYNDAFIPGSLDYKHMKLGNIAGDLSEIELLGDTIKVRIKGLTAIDFPSKTYLKKLDTKMTFGPGFWEYDELDLKVGRSHVRNFVRFDYRIFHNFTDFNDSVSMTVHLDSSLVYSDDIAYFAPQVKDLKEKILANSVDFKGYVRRFDAKNVDLVYGNYSHVIGNVSASGLPNIKETFAELKLKPSTLSAKDLKHYIPDDAFVYADRFGTVKLQGQFVGFYNDFVANGSFKTALGNFVSDINLKFNKDITRSSYRGYLKTDNFDVGRLIGNPEIVQTISMDGRVQGTGFDAKSAQLQLDATVNAITLNGYNYRNITTNGNFSRQAFVGEFKINDPNLQATGNGTINLEPGNQRFDLTTNIEKADLQALKIADIPLQFKTSATLDFTGLTLDQMLGTANLNETVLTYAGKPVHIDTLNLTSTLPPEGRRLDLRSELLNFSAKGNFQFTTLIRDINTLLTEYRLNFQNDATATANYYRRKTNREVPADYGLDFKLKLKKPNPLLHIFTSDLSISGGSELTGTFRNGQTAIFGLGGKLDTVFYGKNAFYKNQLEVTSSKLPFSPDVLAQAFVTSEKQELSGAGTTEKFFVEGIWNQRKISFSSNIAQTNTTNRAAIAGELNFLNGPVEVVFNKSVINVLDKSWSISPENKVVFRGDEIQISNLVLSHGNQRLSVSGLVSENPTDALSLTVTDFNLDNLNALMEQKMRGVLNASLNARDLYNQAIITSQLKVDSLYFDEILIGNVAGNTDWDRRKSLVEVNMGITRDTKKVLSVTGNYNPDGGDQQLNLLGVFDDAQIKLVEPFLKVVMHDMHGTMEGRIRVLGKLDAPILKGVANVSNGRFNFTYLNTEYSFSDRVYFAENGITFRNIKLKDIFGNTATLNGGVYHDGFQNMVIDLKANFRKFMVLNTTRKLNDLYYGSAIASGDASVFGPPSNLTVNVNVRSDKGTRISIPLDNQAQASRQSFIHFVKNDTADSVGIKAVAVKPKVDLSGIKLNLNLEVTDDAYVEIIFDEKAGDIVRGNGNGRIRMNIDTRGEFNMYGQYEVTRGAYNFTLYNLVNKEFIVRPGGTINWNGDPYAGILNITAVYNQRVSLNEILQNTTTGNNDPQLNRRYPVAVVMGLTGNLLTPEIKLDLEFTDIPSQLETQLQPFISNVRKDEQELNRQVFSLLVFKRLSPSGEFLGLSGGDYLSTFSELISNQLSYWISQVDSNLDGGPVQKRPLNK